MDLDATCSSHDVCEMAFWLIRSPDKAEAAYRPNDLFEKRRKLMEAWARYCATPKVEGGAITQAGAVLSA
jgi:hypothetical protein